MALKSLAVAAALLASASPGLAQEGSWVFGIGLRGVLTTSAKLFYSPDSPSEALRSQYEMLQNIPGVALELRARPPGSAFFLALSGEYQRKTSEKQKLVAVTTPPITLPVVDGYWMVPLEASANVDVPLGSQEFSLTMGAGVGIYYAERVLEVAGIPAKSVDVQPAFGIHVRTSAEYKVTSQITAILELRFRNPQVSTSNQFQTQEGTIGGEVIGFPQEEISGRLDLDGMVVGLGVVIGL